MAYQAGAYHCFRSMKRLGVFLLSLDGMLVHRRVTPSSKFASTHLYTWVERGTVRVKCLPQEHNVVTWSKLDPETQSRIHHTNHYATAPPTPVNKSINWTGNVALFLIYRLEMLELITCRSTVQEELISCIL